MLSCQCPRPALGKRVVWEASTSLETVEETAGRTLNRGSTTFLRDAFRMSFLPLVLPDLGRSYVVTIPVPGHVHHQSGPADLTSHFDLGPCHDGHARQSLDCRLTLPTVPGPNTDSISQCNLSPASSLPTCLWIWTVGWPLSSSPDLLCSPHSGTVGLNTFSQGHCPVYPVVTFSPKLPFPFGTAHAPWHYASGGPNLKVAHGIQFISPVWSIDIS